MSRSQKFICFLASVLAATTISIAIAISVSRHHVLSLPETCVIIGADALAVFMLLSVFTWWAKEPVE